MSFAYNFGILFILKDKEVLRKPFQKCKGFSIEAIGQPFLLKNQILYLIFLYQNIFWLITFTFFNFNIIKILKNNSVRTLIGFYNFFYFPHKTIF